MPTSRDPQARSAARLRAMGARAKLHRPKKPRFLQEEKPIVFGLNSTQIFGLGMLAIAFFVGVILRS